MDPSRLQFTPTVAGVWTFIDDSYVTAGNGGVLGNSFFGNVGLGASQLTGVVMIGWQYSGFDNESGSVTPVNVGILEQQPDGTLLLDTASYVSNASTQGGGSVIVADFNGDGRDDIFLAAHNESPFLLQPSTVLLSNAQGTFDRIVLDDAVMAHDAQLAWVGGEPVVITASFSEDYAAGRTSPSYRWTGSGFSVTEGELRNGSDTGGMSVAMGDLDGNGDLEMVIGDFSFGLGVPWDPAGKFKIAIYDANAQGSDIVGTGPLAILTPYFEARPEYADVESLWGPANTHSYRVWLDDFNHDGLLDILAGQSLWTQANEEWPSMLQMWQNKGGLEFEDVSDTLNPDFDVNTGELDYQTQFIDLDGSGIDSILSAGRGTMAFDGSQWVNLDHRHSNWLLVNDGTGRLHVALHDEFIEIGRSALQYASSVSGDLFVNPNQQLPKIHGFLNAQGQLNFIAEVQTYRQEGGVDYANASMLVNIPLEIDIRTDFTDAIEIADRNGSMRMRTFAGDDVVRDANAAATASIDGGLGMDTAVYSMGLAAYAVASGGGAWTVSGNGLADTLWNVERLQFGDWRVALDLEGNAGDVAKVLGAVFGPSAVAAPGLVGIGLHFADAGLDYESLMDLALTAALGPDATHEQVVDLLYTNVVGVHPSAGHLEYFVSLLDDGSFTPATLGMLAADTPMNLANIGAGELMQHGLAYL